MRHQKGERLDRWVGIKGGGSIIVAYGYSTRTDQYHWFRYRQEDSSRQGQEDSEAVLSKSGGGLGG